MNRPTMILVLLTLLFYGCSTTEVPLSNDRIPERIVSMVPSITEILFDIGVGEKIVGDSTFTIYPPETEKIEKIGGLYDTNWERIVSLKPDLIIGLVENESFVRRAKELRLRTFTVEHRRLDGVLESYEQLGALFGPEVLDRAIQKRDALKRKFDAIAERTTTPQPKRVMLCLDRTRGAGRIQNLFIAGTNPFFEDVIKIAGGVNVGTETGVPIPTLSVEGVIQLKPEVIIELITGEGNVASGKLTDEERQRLIAVVQKDWQTLEHSVDAVKHRRIYLFFDDFTTIPGPRTPLLIEKIASVLAELHAADADN